VACPLCRKEFTLSSNGVVDLPKNFFVAKLLQMKELSSVENKTGRPISGQVYRVPRRIFYFHYSNLRLYNCAARRYA